VVGVLSVPISTAHALVFLLRGLRVQVLHAESCDERVVIVLLLSSSIKSSSVLILVLELFVQLHELVDCIVSHIITSERATVGNFHFDVGGDVFLLAVRLAA